MIIEVNTWYKPKVTKYVEEKNWLLKLIFKKKRKLVIDTDNEQPMNRYK